MDTHRVHEQEYVVLFSKVGGRRVRDDFGCRTSPNARRRPQRRWSWETMTDWAEWGKLRGARADSRADRMVRASSSDR